MILVGGVMIHAPAFFDWLYRRAWYGEMMRDWAFALPQGAQAKVLDLGCGPGGLTRDMVRQGWQMTGVDRSLKMINRAQDSGNANFIVADALELPFEGGRFDVVLSASLVNLVPDRVALFAEMARVLRPGGIASVLFPSPRFTLGCVEAQARALPFMSAAALRLWADKPPKCDPDQVLRDAAKAGLVGGVCAPTRFDGVVSVTTQAS